MLRAKFSAHGHDTDAATVGFPVGDVGGTPALGCPEGASRVDDPIRLDTLATDAFGNLRIGHGRLVRKKLSLLGSIGIVPSSLRT